MAKQRGIHQISGKINNLCYYEQKYVRGGLIRRINEAMSQRLKTDPVFANTRHSNTIFGGASIAARVLLNFFGSRNTFLFKPYRHALLTKAVFRQLIERTRGELYPSFLGRDIAVDRLSDVIESIVKNSIFNSFNELERRFYGLSLNDEKIITFQYESLEKFCKDNKCIGVQLSVSRAYYTYAIDYSETVGSYVEAENNAGGRITYVDWYLGEDTEDVDIYCNTGEKDDSLTFWIIYASPIVAKRQGRPITGETGASCGVVTFTAG